MNEEEFAEFWKNFKWPEVKPVYFRLYYNEKGKALFYSQEDLPGKYIDITPEHDSLEAELGLLDPPKPEEDPE